MSKQTTGVTPLPSLIEDYRRTKSFDIATSQFVLQMVFARAAKAVYCAGNIEEWIQLFDTQQSADVLYGISLLAGEPEEAKQLQKRLLVDTIVDTMKTEPDKKVEGCRKVESAIAKLNTILKAIPVEREPRFVLDGNLHDGLKRLIAIAAAPVKTDSDDITQIERYRDELLANKSGLFHKGLTVFATGIAFRMAADKHFDRIRNDRGYSASLIELGKMVATQDPGGI